MEADLQKHYDQNHTKYGGYSPALANMVKPRAHVLDIGCSTGALARVLTQKHCTVVGVDIDTHALELARKNCAQVIHCDLDSPQNLLQCLSAKSFDAITLGDIVEHVKYPRILLKGLAPLLKPNGCIYASIPNAAFISNRLKILAGHWEYDPRGGIMDEDHLRFFSFATAKKLFDDSGYLIEGIYGHSEVRPRYALLRPLAKVWPQMFAIHILITARPISGS